jgi:ribonuclease HI
MFARSKLWKITPVFTQYLLLKYAMPRTIPDFIVEREKKRRKKNTCYAVFLTDAPEQSQIFQGNDAWSHAEHFMKGRPHTHKGFSNQIEANQWMALQNNLLLTGVAPQHPSPKEDAKAAYPERVARARNAGWVVYNTDCSFTRGKECSVGVWSATHFIQITLPQDPETVNHQRGELIGIHTALHNYEKNYLTDPLTKGTVVFTDNEYAARSLNEYHRRYKKHRGTTIWYNSKNNPVMHQDIIQDILRIRALICEHHKGVDLFYVPRELNIYADAVSRGLRIERTTLEDGKMKYKIVE